MKRNFTQRLWKNILKEESLFSSQELFDTEKGPKDETIAQILAYAKSVRGVRTRLNQRILISLN